MTPFKIFAYGFAVVAFMAAAQHERWAQRSGVVGQCAPTQAPAYQPTGAWYVCDEGLLTGFPNLESDSCTLAGYFRERQIWGCTRPVASLPAY